MIISVMFFHGAVKNDFDTRWKSRHLVKQFMEHKVTLTVALVLSLGLLLHVCSFHQLLFRLPMLSLVCSYIWFASISQVIGSEDQFFALSQVGVSSQK